MEAIILAGGFGTRLQKVVSDVPKSMAVINKRPFLEYLFDYLIFQGITKAVISAGYKHEFISEHFRNRYKTLSIDYAIETEPLGTGGGVRLSFWKIDGPRALVLNGDSIFRFDYQTMLDFHLKKKADATIALRQLEQTGRYGRVTVNRNKRITGFAEKEENDGPGFINGGVYIIEKLFLMEPEYRGQFSLEKDCFQRYFPFSRLYGIPADGYFLDIGIPGIMKKQSMNLQDLKIDQTWTLFLDRDGVINRRIEDDYVKSWAQFKFLPGVPDAMKRLQEIFGRIIVVTNQQGIGKGLMTETELNSIHRQMIEEIVSAGGKINSVFFSPHLESGGSVMRKPNVGMALKARRQYPEIRFKCSVMAGDSISDMIFGKRLGMKTILISPENEMAKKHPKLIDFIFPDLISLANEL